jgi:hypothetical protein
MRYLEIYYCKTICLPNPFGDLAEPLLKKAVEDILGHPVPSPK